METKIIIDNKIRLSGNVPIEAHAELERRLTIDNPKYLEAQEHGRWTGALEPQLCFLDRDSEGLTMPRGFIRHLVGILRGHGVPYRLEDRTRALPEVDFQFQGILHDYQKEAAEAILSKRFGVAQMPTGSGKTVVALYCIAERRQPALVICHTKELLYQWRDRAARFLGMDPTEIGLLGDGHCDFGERLTIAIVNTLYKHAEEARERTGHLIVDECHRVSSRTLSEAVAAFDSIFMLGLSATPYRRDKLTRLIWWHVGDRVFSIEPKELQAQGQIMQALLKVRVTGRWHHYDDDYPKMLSDLTMDPERNGMIAHDVTVLARKAKGPLLVVSDRKAHCQALAGRIQAAGIKTALLTGDTANGKRRAVVAAVNQGAVAVLVATLQLIGEGFDCKALSALFLATPVKFSGRVKQIVGRILRTDDGKRLPTVFDYLDEHPVLQSSFRARTRAYEEIGIELD